MSEKWEIYVDSLWRIKEMKKMILDQKENDEVIQNPQRRITFENVHIFDFDISFSNVMWFLLVRWVDKLNSMHKVWFGVFENHGLNFVSKIEIFHSQKKEREKQLEKFFWSTFWRNFRSLLFLKFLSFYDDFYLLNLWFNF